MKSLNEYDRDFPGGLVLPLQGERAPPLLGNQELRSCVLAKKKKILHATNLTSELGFSFLAALLRLS